MSTKIDHNASIDEKKLRMRLASIRQPVKLQYSIFFNTSRIFRNPEAFRFYNEGELSYRVGVVVIFC